MSTLNILIIGGSIAGPSLASLLLLSRLPASSKPRITILERASSIRTEGQNIDIRGVGVDVLQKLGLEADVRRNTTGEAGVQWVDDRNRIVASMDATPGGPTADIEIMRGTLARLLVDRTCEISRAVQAAGGHGVEWLYDDYAESIHDDGRAVHVKLARSGETRSYDIVVGADGLQSTTRKMIWGPQDGGLHRLGVYGAFFSMPPAASDTAYRRWYHASRRRGIMLRPDLPNDCTTCFMHIMNDADRRFRDVAVGMSAVAAQKELMQEHMADAGWETGRVLAQMHSTDDFYYDMIAQVKLDCYSKGRIVLIGDAAYCASPLSGMGTTLALSGAYNLAGLLSRHPDDHSMAFRQYEERMRPVVAQAQRLKPGMLRYLFGVETDWGVWILNTVIGLLFKSGPLLKTVVGYFARSAERIKIEDFELDNWTVHGESAAR